MSKNLLPRTCRMCGTTFTGGPRAWYCPTCRSLRRKEADIRMKAKKKTLDYLPLGSIIQCEICGKDIIKKGGRQRYCEECAAIHLKEIDNQQSLEWKHKYPEKIKEGKRKISKERHAKEGKQSGIKYISWDKGTNKWKVATYVNGKRYHIGRFSDLEKAEKALKDFMEKQDD